jgi:hypothetical protein
MAYKVFLSHSTNDQNLVIALAKILSQFGVEVFVAEWYLDPGQKIDKKILFSIDRSDCIVVLLTKNGMRSAWVQQEIECAIKSTKPIIPLVEKGISSSESGMLQLKEYIEYDPHHPQQALNKITTYVKSLKLGKEVKEKTLLVAGGTLAFLVLLMLSGEEK